jgi:hypothetical protein
MSSKRHDFYDMCKVYQLLLNQQAYSENGMIQVSQIKQGMNSKRTLFNWDHLQQLNFY